MLVDELHDQVPTLDKDKFFDTETNDIQLPYTRASMWTFKRQRYGSAAQIE